MDTKRAVVERVGSPNMPQATALCTASAAISTLRQHAASAGGCEQLMTQKDSCGLRAARAFKKQIFKGYPVTESMAGGV